MIKKTKDSKESKIISTQDIVLGTDINTSALTLDEYLNEQSKDIQNLKKWTKWSIKYGGMGTGSGGGGGSSSAFGYKLYIIDENENIKELTQTTRLDGSGVYTLRVTLSRTQGHSFQIYHWIGTSDKPTGSTFVPEGTNLVDIKLGKRSDKFILSCQIKDNNTDESTDILSYTIIPEPYSTVRALIKNYDGVPITTKAEGRNEEISIDALKAGLTARINYKIFVAITLYVKIRYKFELDKNWTTFSITEINVSENDIKENNIIENFVEKNIDVFKNIDQDRVIGQKLEIEIICSEDSSESGGVAGNNGSFEAVVIPSGFYINLTDGGTGTLYLDLDAVEEDSVKKIRRGLLPFFINLRSTFSSSDTYEVTVSTYKQKSDGTWETRADSISGQLKLNTIYTISEMYEISETDSGIFKIVARSSIGDGGGISTTKYFFVDETSTNWSYDAFCEFDNNANISGGHYINYGTSEYTVSKDHEHSSRPLPNIGTPISLYKKSYETASFNLTGTENVRSFNESVVLGFQYDSSNNDSTSFLRINTSSNGEIDVYQNKVMFGTQVIVDNYYLPKTDNSDITNDNKWHLLHININYIKEDSRNQPSYEFCIYIDGQLEGISKTTYSSSDESISSSGGLTTALNNDFKIKNVILNPNKNKILKINLLDVSRIEHTRVFANRDSGFIVESGSYSYAYDAFAVSYYNKYRSTLGLTEIDREVDYEFATTFMFDDLALPYVTEANISNLLKDNDLDVPIIVLCLKNAAGYSTEENKNIIKNWFYPLWDQGELTKEEENKQVAEGSIIYVPEKTKDESWYKNYRVGRLTNEGNETFVEYPFTFEIQGSSTKSFGIKNIEVKIGGEDGKTRVYTPRFDKTNKKESLLPEESFTLKADMVDSSMCNNNSIGAFVNNNTLPIDETNKEFGTFNEGVGFKDYIKNCLIGFPVLVFLTDKTDYGLANRRDRYYFAGIYNFNLGRKSYFNLGYLNNTMYNSIKELIEEENTPGMTVLELDNDPELNLNSKLSIVEISDNSSYWDFSQYDRSVLFKQDNASDKNFSMFKDGDGDIIGIRANAIDKIKNAVESIAFAGGFIFEKLRRTFIDIGVGEQTTESKPFMEKKYGTSVGGVSNYKTQYTRTLSHYDNPRTVREAQFNDLINCVGRQRQNIDDTWTNITPYLDLRSAVEYYVICQCFGMIDSVMKNLQLKSWGDTTIFPAFYDMDTALGVDNDGKDIVDYFAFSDYWEVSNVLNEDFIETTYNAGEANIYPDFWDKKAGIGFDYPSSYLFALAKYSTMSLLKAEDNLPKMSTGSGGEKNLSPVNMYSYYRSVGGDLESADVFINKYFINRLNGIPTVLKNLNNRSKYAKVSYWRLYDGTGEKFNPTIVNNVQHAGTEIRYSSSLDLNKFAGSGKFKKKDWLNSRLHLLDAYFNLNGGVFYNVKYPVINDAEERVDWVVMTEEDGRTPIFYPQVETSFQYSDVSFLNDIFGDTSVKGNLDATIIVRTHRLTPLVLSVNRTTKSYLIGDNALENSYLLRLTTSGDQSWSLFGSKELGYINDLGQFSILSDQTISSNNLKEVIYLENSTELPDGATGKSINLNTPNIEKIKINGKNYTGKLILGNFDFGRLAEIDLSNSGVILDNDRALKCEISELNLENIVSNSITLPNISLLEDCNVRLNGASITTLTIPEWSNNIVITSDNTLSGYNNYYSNVAVKNLTLVSNNKFGQEKISVTLVNMGDLERVTVSKNVGSLKIKSCNKLKSVTIQTSTEEESFSKLYNLEITGCSSHLENGEMLSINSSVDGTVIIPKIDPNTNFTLNFKGTRYFDQVYIGNSIVHLVDSAFSGCLELAFLNNDENGIYYLDGTSTFEECSNFTLKMKVNDGEEDRFSTIYTEETNKDLTKTFYVTSSSTNIDLNAANAFLDNNKNKGITIIDNLFGHQAGIGADWNWDSNLHINEGYDDVSSCEHAFAKCGINYWTKNLYNFGKNAVGGLDIYGTFYSNKNEGGVHVCIDFLENIRHNLKSYYDPGSDTAPHQYYTFYSRPNVLNNSPKLKDILGDAPKLTSITGFTFLSNSNQVLDLQGCFSGCRNITTINRFLYIGKWKNICWKDANNNTTSCFQTLISDSLTISRSFGTVSGNDEIDLFYLFRDEQWRYISINNDSNPGGTSGSMYTNFPEMFSVKKKITEENFNTLWTILGRNNNLVGLNSLFKNCRVECQGDSFFINKLNNNNSNKGNIKALRELFRGLTAFSGLDPEQQREIPVELSPDFFETLQSVTKCERTFAEIWLKNVPSFDFFRKRKTSLKTGYQKIIESFSTDTETSGKEYVYAVTNSAEENPSEPTFENITDERLTATLLVNREVWSAFSPSTEEAGGTSSWYYYWRAEVENDTIKPSSIRKLKRIKSIELEVKYRTYTTNITKITGIFENCTFETPIFRLEDKENYRSYIKQNGNDTNFTEYYTTDNCTTKGDYFVSTEIDDLSDNIVMDRAAGSYTLGSINITNFKVYPNIEDNDKYPVISPDFFLGVSTNGDISRAFYCDNSKSNNPSDNKYVLEGYLPKNLLKGRYTITASNFLGNLNVFPVKKEDSSYDYVFVPRNFIDNRTNFDNLLNFNIRIPTSTSDQEETSIKYYLIYKDSLLTTPKKDCSFRNCFPIYAKSGGSDMIINSVTRPLDVVSGDYNFHYKLLYIEDGKKFDDIFTSAYYRRFLSAHMIYVLSDNEIWSSGMTMKLLNKAATSDTDSYIINGTLIRYGSEIDGQMGINKYFKFPEANENVSRTSYRVHSGSTLRVNKNSLGTQSSINRWKEGWGNNITVVN